MVRSPAGEVIYLECLEIFLHLAVCRWPYSFPEQQWQIFIVPAYQSWGQRLCQD